jgi:hypothetical protein
MTVTLLAPARHFTVLTAFRRSVNYQAGFRGFSNWKIELSHTFLASDLVGIARPLPWDRSAHCIEKIGVADFAGRYWLSTPGIDND